MSLKNLKKSSQAQLGHLGFLENITQGLSLYPRKRCPALQKLFREYVVTGSPHSLSPCPWQIGSATPCF